MPIFIVAVDPGQFCCILLSLSFASSWVAGLSLSFLFRCPDKLAPCAFQKHAANETVYKTFIHSAIPCYSVLSLMNFIPRRVTRWTPPPLQPIEHLFTLPHITFLLQCCWWFSYIILMYEFFFCPKSDSYSWWWNSHVTGRLCALYNSYSPQDQLFFIMYSYSNIWYQRLIGMMCERWLT